MLFTTHKYFREPEQTIDRFVLLLGCACTNPAWKNRKKSIPVNSIRCLNSGLIIAFIVPVGYFKTAFLMIGRNIASGNSRLAVRTSREFTGYLIFHVPSETAA